MIFQLNCIRLEPWWSIVKGNSGKLLHTEIGRYTKLINRYLLESKMKTLDQNPLTLF